MSCIRAFLPLLILLGVSCRKDADSAPPPSTVRGPDPAIPAAWAPLNLPSSGLEVVSADTDEHGFYADYRGSDRQALLDEVSRRLVAAGYTQSCTAEDGYVLGFSKGERQLAAKVDAVGVLMLSVFDESGKEPLLHGLCFGRYHAGPSHTLDANEKGAFAKQFDDDEAKASPAPTASGESAGKSPSPPVREHQ